MDQQKSVDLSLVKGKEKVAVEISITTDSAKELLNIQKNLAAGYDRIILLCASTQTLDNIRKRVKQSISPKEQGIIFITPLTDLFQHI